MKINHLSRYILGTGISLALAAVFAFPVNSKAAEQLKGAQLLAGERPAPVVSQALPAEQSFNPAACPACTNITKLVATHAGRGAFVKTTAVTTHQCPMCKTTITTVGGGKAKAEVAAHTCGSGNMASSCSGMTGM